MEAMCTIQLMQAISGESLGSICITSSAFVRTLRLDVQSKLGGWVKLFYNDCELHHADMRLSEVGISDGSEVLVLSTSFPHGRFQAQYHGNGCSSGGPYHAGFNYTAHVTASFDGMGKCDLWISEDCSMFGDKFEGGQYECVVEGDHDNLKLRAVRERTWYIGSSLGADGEAEWQHSSKCFSGAVDPSQDCILLDLSILHGYGPECPLDRVVPTGKDRSKL